MTLPLRRDWIFAAKTFAAAMLALYIALLFDLPRPYWSMATVYITSQLFAGATGSKAVFRVCGTMIGGVMAVILVSNLANAPVLLSLAMALWVAVCLYASLLDRTPRGYLFMLAGYTAPLIGFPCVDDPASIFDVAVARSEEISLGIICASLVSSIVLPQPVAGAIKARLATWLSGARSLSLQAFTGSERGAGSKAALSLAAAALTLETLGTHLAFESSRERRSPRGLAMLRQHMLMALPIIAAVADRAEALRAQHAMPDAAERLLTAAGDLLQRDDTSAVAAAQVREAAEMAAPADPRTWNELLLASLMGRVIDYVDLRQDIRALLRHVSDGTALPALRFRYTAAARIIRHRDHGMALRSAFGAFLALIATCAIWIATGWPDGSGAPMFAAVVCCFFAAQDDPAPAILQFTNASIIGALLAAFYLFVVLPLATNFEMLVVMLAPVLLLCGVLMQQPRTAGMALGGAVTGLALLALQGSFVADFASFTNTAISLILGMWVSALITRLVRSVDGAWSARRLLRKNGMTLVAAARGHGGHDGVELAALMLDRLALVSARFVHVPAEDDLHAADLLAEVRAGINIVELRRGRRHLPADARRALDTVIAALPKHLAGALETTAPELLRAIDAALDATAVPAGRTARLGLVGLRRALFPDALPYMPTIIPFTLELAA
ncbi:FUSC family protein [Beijerinckia sp. L45]|uniref:FUSC family protein n=1 Tax=Beijerinckia sp. L45 TaxID=1641855 RepID=UPI00131C3B3A|nr:FUSC family protein [Beijerinckia sp. L45]